ncbi:MAG: carboxypeptidase-like regulatory domain-containing protein [Chitinophagaceae bacterium]|nr:carboxypeptidase-like regulatory domain-containing protein [Chitinophagaceae bacterium]
MKRGLLTIILLFPITVFATLVKGKISNEKGEGLSFASIYIKGTTKGTTANNDGYYRLDAPAGKHTFIVQYMGYQRQEFELQVGGEEIQKNIVMKEVNTSLKELVVKADENLALKIIKKCIKKRSYYNKQIEKYKSEVYVKTVLKLDETPDSNQGLFRIFVGGGDSASRQEMEQQKGIQYLAETVNDLYFKKPNKRKLVVKSSRISGEKSGYGLSSPLNINLYENNVNFSDQMTPRGVVSPIADGAPVSYEYEMLGSYIEDKKLVYRIKISPKRKFEPLFTGVLEIMDNEYRIHAADLELTKEHGLEMFDSVRLKQMFAPMGNHFVVKDQSMKLRLKLFGFSISGNLVNVFNDYQFDYDDDAIFNKYEREYAADALTKKSTQWDTLRPLSLDKEEQNNYRVKDSVAALPPKPDSSGAKNTLRTIVLNGYRKANDSTEWSTSSVVGLYNVNWNTMEGFNYKFRVARLQRFTPDKSLNQALVLRYGLSNQQLNGYYKASLRFGKTSKNLLRLGAGRYVFQYNNEEPVNELLNSFYTLLYAQNFYKNYQAWFGNLEWKHRFVRSFEFTMSLGYQQRQALANTNWYTLRKNHNELTENYPAEIMTGFFPNHNALLGSVEMKFQPGQKLIKYPDRVVATPSDWPEFQVALTLGLPLLGSDVDYSKWQAAMNDDIHINLWGDFSYRIAVGGFLYNTKSYLPDYTHYNGGQIILASPYLNSFQLSPYYLNSNTQSFYTLAHAEHHFKGLLTNKIPLFRNLRYYLVAAGNAYYVNKNNNYMEASLGLENVGYGMFRFLRVDGVVGYTNLKKPMYGIRVGLSGLSGISFGFQQKNKDY